VQRLFLNLLKCMYSHRICSPKTGITLFVKQRVYVHLEPPDVICTVVVFVNIAARQQRFRAASLLPQMMSANDGPGRGPTSYCMYQRRSTMVAVLTEILRLGDSCPFGNSRKNSHMGMFSIWGSLFPYSDPHTET
jgi:hypothetical protein